MGGTKAEENMEYLRLCFKFELLVELLCNTAVTAAFIATCVASRTIDVYYVQALVVIYG